MQKLVFSIVVLSTVASCFAASALGPAQVHDSHPNMCYEAEKEVFYNPAESWQLDYCGIATCTHVNYTGTPQLMVSYQSCGVVSVDPPCYLTEDTTLSYPDCCPQPTCPEGVEAEADFETETEGKQEGESDADNEIEDNADAYSEAKAERLQDFYSQNYKKRSSVNGEASKKGFSAEAGSWLDGEEGSYFGSPFYRTSPDDLQYLDLFPETKDRKVSPRFHYLESENPSFYQWF